MTTTSSPTSPTICKVGGCSNPVPPPSGKGGRAPVYCGIGDHTAQRQAEITRQQKLKSASAAATKVQQNLRTLAEGVTPEAGMTATVKTLVTAVVEGGAAAAEQAALLESFAKELENWQDTDLVENRLEQADLARRSAELAAKDARNAERVYRSSVNHDLRKRQAAELERDAALIQRDTATSHANAREDQNRVLAGSNARLLEERDTATQARDAALADKQRADDLCAVALGEVTQANEEREQALIEKGQALTSAKNCADQNQTLTAANEQLRTERDDSHDEAVRAKAELATQTSEREKAETARKEIEEARNDALGTIGELKAELKAAQQALKEIKEQQ